MNMDWDFPSSYCTTTLHLTIPTPQRTPCAWTWIVARTIVITGANSFLAIPDVQHLLAKHTKHALLLTVRNTSDTDVHTRRLHGLRKQYPDADFSIRELDLNKLSAVHDFATTIVAEIDDGKLVPLASIVCNAYYWNLAREVEFTTDSYEKTFQVTYVAHAALVLRLLGSFGPSGGRVVLFSSYAHWSGKNLLEKYPPAIPTNLQSLVKPAADDPPDNFGRGFQRYAVSKLAVVMWMYVLNRRLEKVCRAASP